MELKMKEKQKGDLNPKHLLKVFLCLRKISSDGIFLTQDGIREECSLTRSQVSTALASIEKYLVIKMINNPKNTGPRKLYKLNEKGEKKAYKFIDKGLKSYEKRILDLYNKISISRDNKFLRDFWTMIDLFYEYAFTENSYLFSEMLRNFISSVKKFFKYEIQFNHVLIPEQETIQD